jgi:methionine salvage enolase-phosphatase E1
VLVQATAGGKAFPTSSASKAEVVDAAVAWVHEAIAQDRKIGALKQLQGHVWRAGFKTGKLTAELFR